MTLLKKFVSSKRLGSALLISMMFIIVVSALAVSMATLSGTNAQLAENQHKVNSALLSAQSGIECGKYIAATTILDKTGYNYVSDAEANKAWSDLYQRLQSTALDGKGVRRHPHVSATLSAAATRLSLNHLISPPPVQPLQ